MANPKIIVVGGGLAGLAAVGVLGVTKKRPWRAALVIGLALAMLVPCAYVTFLWNRLRYLWPFATGADALAREGAQTRGDTLDD